VVFGYLFKSFFMKISFHALTQVVA